MTVLVDDRLRLLAAALLLTGIPDREQGQYAHKVHPLADVAAAELDSLRAHPAVRMIEAAADQQPFLIIVPHVLRLSLPDLHPRTGVVVEPWEEIPLLTGEDFLQSFRDFRDEVERRGLWRTTAPAWQTLVDDLSSVLAERDMAGFLALFWGETGRPFVVLPNPLAPRLERIGLYAPEANYAVLPPPAIPPDSSEPPTYASRSAATRYVACHELSHGAEFRARKRTPGLEPAIAEVMSRTPAGERFRTSYPGDVWPFSEILLRAVQVLYARHHEDTETAALFLGRHRGQEGLETLAEWAGRLEPYLEGRRAGRYRGWDEYLPNFLTALRTAS
ncbi:MAG: hypothetical protein ACRDF5_12580 [bacterium]